MATGVYKITEEFEKELSEYTGAPFVVTVDNASNGLYLCLLHEKIAGKELLVPNRTYPSVPCEVIRAVGKVKFYPVDGTTLKGPYQLYPSRVWDSALRFTYGMYIPDSLMCISFTGPYKHFKLSKGGAVLTDNFHTYNWLKRARFSGRRECSYHDDNLDFIGMNCYLMPELSARGLLMMAQLYDFEGKPKHNDDLEIPYPDLSKFPIYTKATGIGGLDE